MDIFGKAVHVMADTSIPALYVTRVLDQVKAKRRLPKVGRTDNSSEFSGRMISAAVLNHPFCSPASMQDAWGVSNEKVTIVTNDIACDV